MIIGSFIFFLFMFIAIGLLSSFKRKSTTEDYLVAGRQVHPFLITMSAVATVNSGFMFVGIMGATYKLGIGTLVILFGLFLGDFLTWPWAQRRIRKISGKEEIQTYTGLLGLIYGKRREVVIKIVGLITVIFLSIYAAAQLTAGSKALEVLFDWPYEAGAVLGAMMILAYCMAGGLRASIWTDTAQGIVMIGSMLLLMVVGLVEVGGIAGLIDKVNAINPALLDITPEVPYGISLFFLGWVFAGLGTLGQPHVMIRYMALNDVKSLPWMRWGYIGLNLFFSVIAVVTGLLCKVLLPEVEGFDVELALPNLSMMILPSISEIFVGLMLAGLFAATMSTADSAVLSSSAALTQNLLPRKYVRSYNIAKLGTMSVTALVLYIALWGPRSVMDLVFLAWSGPAAAFAPFLVVRLLGGKPGEALTVLMMLFGFTVMLAWKMLGYGDGVYEVLPGMLAGFTVYGAAWLLKQHKV